MTLQLPMVNLRYTVTTKEKIKLYKSLRRHDIQVSIGVDKTKINAVLLLRPAYCDAQATFSKL